MKTNAELCLEIRLMKAHKPTFLGLLLGAAVFISFFNSGLPVAPNESIRSLYPPLASPWRIDRLSFHEIILSLYFLFFIVQGAISKKIVVYVDKHLLNFVLLLVMMALLLMISSITDGSRPKLDIFRAARLIEHAVIAVLICDFSKKYGIGLLKFAVYGMFVASIISTWISLKIPLSDENFIFHGQNTSIVNFAIGLHFISLIYHIEKTIHPVFYIIASVFFILVVVGGSRIAYAITVFWVFGLISSYLNRYRFGPGPRITGTVIIGSLICFSLLLLPPIQHKFERVINSNFYGDQQRLEMVQDSFSIAASYPIGVGLSGYFNAREQLHGGSQQALTTIDFEDNPHSTILYYLAAGGFLGFILTTGLLWFSFFGLKRYLDQLGNSFYVPYILLSYFIIVLAVPYLYNSLILILPFATLAGAPWKKYE